MKNPYGKGDTDILDDLGRYRATEIAVTDEVTYCNGCSPVLPCTETERLTKALKAILGATGWVRCREIAEKALANKEW